MHIKIPKSYQETSTRTAETTNSINGWYWRTWRNSVMLVAVFTATSTWKTVSHYLLKLNRHILYNPAMLSVFTV